MAEVTEEREHTEQHGMPAELGAAWDYDVWIARNHGRSWSKGRLGALPSLNYRCLFCRRKLAPPSG